jgi:putative DNA primase/helicase
VRDSQAFRSVARGMLMEPNGDRGLIRELADTIIRRDSFAADGGGRLYRYEHGVYRTKGEIFVKRRVSAVLEEWNQTAKWRTRLGEEVVELIRLESRTLWDRPPATVINVGNGLLNLQEGVLLPHSAEHLCSVQLPITFDSEATCDVWDEFANTTFPTDANEVAFEIPALLMAPITGVQKAAIFLGDGGNGKSTYLNALTAFLGKPNVSSLSLHRLESDKFAAARLVGKLANICADLPSEHLASTSIFKAIVGGDPITAEYKFHDPFDLLPYARLVFSANQAPRSADSSDGFFRRWIVIPFTRTFSPGAEGFIRKEVLDAVLSDPRELSGVLNRALSVWRRVRADGITLSPSMREAWDELRAATDPLAVWLDTATTENPSAVVAQGDLLSAYRRACEKGGRSPVSQQAFGRAIRRFRPRVQHAQRTICGRVKWVYIGLGLLASEEEHG